MALLLLRFLSHRDRLEHLSTTSKCMRQLVVKAYGNVLDLNVGRVLINAEKMWLEYAIQQSKSEVCNDVKGRYRSNCSFCRLLRVNAKRQLPESGVCERCRVYVQQAQDIAQDIESNLEGNSKLGRALILLNHPILLARHKDHKMHVLFFSR